MTDRYIMSHIQSANDVISSQQSIIRKFASENEALRRSGASFDEAALRKIASDVHALYGSPSNIHVDQLVDLWKSNPSTLLGTMQKLASAQLASVATGNHLGAPAHEVKVTEKTTELDADSMFRSKYE